MIELWDQWLEDEISVAGTVADEKRIHALFEEAVHEYLCMNE